MIPSPSVAVQPAINTISRQSANIDCFDLSPIATDTELLQTEMHLGDATRLYILDD
jgi:hypothetical protein